ncbi:MAG: four helix bundle protein [Patescibacteria group bacterium]
MTEIQNSKQYDLENRTLYFAKEVAIYVNKLPLTVPNKEYGKQLVRSASSIGANYLEANEALSRKDFLMRIKISRKEAKETRFWLQLAEVLPEMNTSKDKLIQEVTELMKIFGAIIEKSKPNV